MNNLTDSFVLANGVEIPCVGFGTWQSEDGPVAVNAVRTALDVGYRHIDTAWAYFNEESVGKAIRESGIDREKIFVTTKLWNCDQGYNEALAAFEKSTSLLKTDYVDLYLIHWPIPCEHKNDWESLILQTWKAFEKLYRDGRIRAIGVCNCKPRHLAHIAKNSEIAPMVDQIELHPGFPQTETVAYCRDHNVLVQAWSPLAQGRVFDLPLLARLKQKYQKSFAQICLRWEIQNGINPLPKSVTPSRIKENAEIFDFALTESEVAEIDSLPEYGAAGFDPDDFNYPSAVEGR